MPRKWKPVLAHWPGYSHKNVVGSIWGWACGRIPGRAVCLNRDLLQQEMLNVCFAAIGLAGAWCWCLQLTVNVSKWESGCVRIIILRLVQGRRVLPPMVVQSGCHCPLLEELAKSWCHHPEVLQRAPCWCLSVRLTVFWVVECRQVDLVKEFFY